MDKMKYKEVVELFFDKEFGREWTIEPFINDDGNVWATDGKAALIVPTEIAEADYKKLSKPIATPSILPENEWRQYSILQLVDALGACDKVPIMTEVKIECPECNGEGVVEWEYLAEYDRESYTHEFDCPVCDGCGYIYINKPTDRYKVSSKSAIRINGVIFSATQINRIIETMQLLDAETLQMVSEYITFKPIIFQIAPNVRIIQMPLNGSDGKVVDLEKFQEL